MSLEICSVSFGPANLLVVRRRLKNWLVLSGLPHCGLPLDLFIYSFKRCVLTWPSSRAQDHNEVFRILRPHIAPLLALLALRRIPGELWILGNIEIVHKSMLVGLLAVISVISVVPPTMYVIGARVEEPLTLRLYHYSCGFCSAYFRSYWHQLQASASSGVS